MLARFKHAVERRHRPVERLVLLYIENERPAARARCALENELVFNWKVKSGTRRDNSVVSTDVLGSVLSQPKKRGDVSRRGYTRLYHVRAGNAAFRMLKRGAVCHVRGLCRIRLPSLHRHSTRLAGNARLRFAPTSASTEARELLAIA